MRLISMILMAVDELEHERKLSSNVPTEKLDPIIPDLPLKGKSCSG